MAARLRLQPATGHDSDNEDVSILFFFVLFNIIFLNWTPDLMDLLEFISKSQGWF